MQIVKERNDLLLLLSGSNSSGRKHISFFFSLRFMGQLCATNERVNMKSYLKYATNLSHFGLLAKNSKVLK